MPSTDRLVDALGLFLTGGATNTNPDLSLGGLPSSRRVRGLGSIVDYPIVAALRIDNVYPANGEGVGTLSITATGELTWTPPGASAGTPVAVPAGESRIVAGTDANKAVRVFKEAGLTALPSTSEAVELVPIMNGALAHANVSHAQRLAGVTTYRAIALVAPGAYGVTDLRLWMPPVADAQAVFSLATETPVAGSIQTIANETTAPTGLSWSTPTSEGSALRIPPISPGSPIGLWIRRVFPASGSMNVKVTFKLSMKYKGA